MDKNAIKKYAVWARNELIARVTQKAQQYGITETDIIDANADSINGKLLSDTEKKQRQALIKKIKEENFEQVMEEVAYTWFNRFTALRFMEVNNYLPSHTRVFTNEANEFKPQILADAISLDLDGLDMDKVYELKDANKNEELYKYLLIVQCNALNRILPVMFQKIDDYTEILFPDNLLRTGSVIEKMVSDIAEKDWEEAVEIIGWLYQFYIADPKDELINAKKQYKLKDVPFVTQIFTSDWIVKYMVENSLGRLWAETGAEISSMNWEYFLTPSVVEYQNNTVDPKEIKIIDPCMGSGHILVYAFDVLMQIYQQYGYGANEAAENILKYNLYGMDISERAYQLAYFSVMMRARKYSRSVLRKQIRPNIHLLVNEKKIESGLLEFYCDNDDELRKSLLYIFDKFEKLGTIGSLITIEKNDFSKIEERLEIIRNNTYDDLISLSYQYECNNYLTEIINKAKTISNKYDVVVTNPPYIGNKFLPSELKEYIEANYKDYKSDIFSAFVPRVIELCKKDGHIGMLTPYVWMFISTYEMLRDKVLNETTITSLVQLEYNAFEAACVPVCSFTLKKGEKKGLGEYIRLSDFKGADIQGPRVKEAVQNRECGYRYTTNQKEYSSIPGSPIAFWVDTNLIECFKIGERVDSFAYPKQGLATADNNRFLRLWFEVDRTKLALSCKSGDEAASSNAKWFPYNKGGGFKKWYGNNEYVINWENDGKELRNFKGSVIRSPQFYFQNGISWCKITSSSFSMRYIPEGFLFDVAGCTLFVDEGRLLYLLGYMNSKLNAYLLQLISPTLNYEVGHVGSLPIIFSDTLKNEVVELVKSNIDICKDDWDSYENSWDFKANPLVKKGKLQEIYEQYKIQKENNFVLLKNNEQRLNSIFNDIYNANDILKPEVRDDEIIIGMHDYGNDIRALISYAVGCMFGRYSLDESGLVYAGGTWEETKYKTYKVDQDNIIPICDDEYFDDDIVNRFVEFVEVAFGKEYLENNLDFIAGAFKYNGNSRQIIRQYFLNDFYNDHCNLYTSRGAGKRPIYWLFDSGKKGGFKALIYMHRYQPDTIARIRTDYVHEQQSRYRTVLEDYEQRLNAASSSDRVKFSKMIKVISEKSEELRIYEEKIHHLADQMISIDLDDGVKTNYDKFKDVLAKIK